MKLQRPVAEIIKERYSCRTYKDKPIEADTKRKLEEALLSQNQSPFKSGPRFILATATDEDRNSLKDLGTYGFIKDAAGFIIGAVKESDKSLEDYGYILEKLILYATDLGLGTCWLGGSFKKSNFSKKISSSGGEIVPAVVAVGYRGDKARFRDEMIRRGAGSKKRMPWQDIFFSDDFKTPLGEDDAGDYAACLEMLRLAPSASNRQPWRIIKERSNNRFHFYLQRTKGYYQRNKMLFKMADLQRIDMGIAMCHFELSASHLNLRGVWKINNPGIKNLPESYQYTVSWSIDSKTYIKG